MMHLSTGVHKAPPIRSEQVSWTSLLATSMGIDGFGRRRVCVRAEVADDDSRCVVVQAYNRKDLRPGSRPTLFHRPVAVALRVVSADDLGHGVDLVLVESGEPLAEDCVIIAWTERSASDVEFDGLRARPTAASCIGTGCGANDIELVLEAA